MIRFATCLAASLTAAIALAEEPAAIDYAMIDRTLIKEPRYTSKSPQYALLLFGRDAALRVWAVLDGEILYLDRNGNGDLTEEGEFFFTHKDCKDIVLSDPDAKTTYVISSISPLYSLEYKGEERQSLMVYVDVRGPVSYRQYCDAVVAEKPSESSVAHFHGPLTAGPLLKNWKLSRNLALVLGGEPTDMRMYVSTTNAQHNCWVVVCSDNGKREEYAFDDAVRPVLTIEFPPKDASATPIIEKIALKQHCCGCLFYDKVEVPSEAGTGMAKVTYSFDAWKEGQVSPSSIYVPVISTSQRIVVRATIGSKLAAEKSKDVYAVCDNVPGAKVEVSLDEEHPTTLSAVVEAGRDAKVDDVKAIVELLSKAGVADVTLKAKKD